MIWPPCYCGSEAVCSKIGWMGRYMWYMPALVSRPRLRPVHVRWGDWGQIRKMFEQRPSSWWLQGLNISDQLDSGQEIVFGSQGKHPKTSRAQIVACFMNLSSQLWLFETIRQVLKTRRIWRRYIRAVAKKQDVLLILNLTHAKLLWKGQVGGYN